MHKTGQPQRTQTSRTSGIGEPVESGKPQEAKKGFFGKIVSWLKSNHPNFIKKFGLDRFEAFKTPTGHSKMDMMGERIAEVKEGLQGAHQALEEIRDPKLLEEKIDESPDKRAMEQPAWKGKSNPLDSKVVMADTKQRAKTGETGKQQPSGTTGNATAPSAKQSSGVDNITRAKGLVGKTKALAEKTKQGAQLVSGGAVETKEAKKERIDNEKKVWKEIIEKPHRRENLEKLLEKSGKSIESLNEKEKEVLKYLSGFSNTDILIAENFTIRNNKDSLKDGIVDAFISTKATNIPKKHIFNKSDKTLGDIEREYRPVFTGMLNAIEEGYKAGQQ